MRLNTENYIQFLIEELSLVLDLLSSNHKKDMNSNDCALAGMICTKIIYNGLVKGVL